LAAGESRVTLNKVSPKASLKGGGVGIRAQTLASINGRASAHADKGVEILGLGNANGVQKTVTRIVRAKKRKEGQKAEYLSSVGSTLDLL